MIKAAEHKKTVENCGECPLAEGATYALRLTGEKSSRRRRGLQRFYLKQGDLLLVTTNTASAKPGDLVITARGGRLRRWNGKTAITGKVVKLVIEPEDKPEPTRELEFGSPPGQRNCPGR